MNDFEIDFEWPVAKYEYRPAAPWDFSIYVDEYMRPRILNGKVVREALSREDAVRVVGGFDIPLGHLIRKSTARLARPSPKAMQYAVKLLVECKETPLHKVALTIARTIGGLLPATEFDEEELENWAELADYLRGIFKGDHKGFGYAQDDSNASPLIGEVGIFLDRDREGKLKFALRPVDLERALVLYAARMATTGTALNTCEHCNTPFLSGGSGRSKKRGDARFCSADCRWKHHNEMRRKAKSKL